MTSIGDTIELQQNDGDNQGRSRLTPELFARLVHGYSKQSKHPLYPGKHYAALGRLLMSSYQHRSTEGENPEVEDSSSNAVFLYDLSLETTKTDRVHAFKTVEELDSYNEESRRKQPGGRLIFLQGYLSPRWLNHIGSKFEIDPEFYLRHLDFSFSQQSPEHYPMLSLPSCAEIIRVRITSILSWSNFQPLTHESTPHLRSLCEKQMKDYLRHLSKGQGVAASDSIVRRFCVFDTNHFAMEQMMTVHVNYDNPGWTAMIWLDQGRDLQLSSHGPWKDLQRGHAVLAIQPIIQYRRRIALHGGGEPRPQDEHRPTGHPIVTTYGNSLRPDIMESDTFYALDEIFRLAIASESQFLTLVEHKVKQAIVGDRIEDLQNALTIIEEHRKHIQENMCSVKAGGHAKWPKASEQLRPKALANKERLLKDLDHLLNFVDHLVDRCTGGISVMMNEAMFRQSQRAIEQTDATIKLGLLVFLFAPLSVTTSFFSMSIKELKDPSPSIWVWAVASGVMLSLSFVVWKWNLSTLIKEAWIRTYVFLSPTSKRYRR